MIDSLTALVSSKAAIYSGAGAAGVGLAWVLKKIPNDIFDELETNSVYKGYIERQLQDIIDLKKDEDLKIPENINYKKIPNLSNEVLEKLIYTKPKNMNQIMRTSGVTPAAVINILRFLNRKNRIISKKKNKCAI